MRIAARALFPLAIAAVIGGCGSSGEGGGGTVVTPTPSPGASPSPSPSPGPNPSPSPSPTTWGGAAAALYDTPPDIAACRAGTLKAGIKAEFLARFNEIRARHNLPAVTYSTAEDTQQADSSLMMAANVALSHTPPANWLCYTSGGSTAAGASNLIGGWGTGLGFDSEDDLLAGWLREGGNPQLGHRRWILHPFLGKTSYGRVSALLPDGRRATAASMRVFSFAGGVSPPSGVPPYVGFPQGDYPARYFALTDYLSFSVVPAATNNGADRSVDFSSATVTVRGPSGDLPVTNVSRDNDGYGVANNIQWRVTGLAANSSYTVVIAGVRNAPQPSYSYGFRIIP